MPSEKEKHHIKSIEEALALLQKEALDYTRAVKETISNFNDKSTTLEEIVSRADKMMSSLEDKLSSYDSISSSSLIPLNRYQELLEAINVSKHESVGKGKEPLSPLSTDTLTIEDIVAAFNEAVNCKDSFPSNSRLKKKSEYNETKIASTEIKKMGYVLGGLLILNVTLSVYSIFN